MCRASNVICGIAAQRARHHMSDLGLTKEERGYVERVARDEYGAKLRAGFYACVIAPSVAFGTYGFVKHDFVAEFIAFIGLFLFMWWRISQELQRLDVFKSLFLKIARHEKESGGA